MICRPSEQIWHFDNRHKHLQQQKNYDISRLAQKGTQPHTHRERERIFVLYIRRRNKKKRLQQYPQRTNSDMENSGRHERKKKFAEITVFINFYIANFPQIHLI